MNSFLVDQLTNNSSTIDSRFNPQLDYIIQSVRSYSSSAIVSFDQLQTLIPSINIGTPEQPNNISLNQLDFGLFYSGYNYVRGGFWLIGSGAHIRFV
jgi:hypothetical protein